MGSCCICLTSLSDIENPHPEGVSYDKRNDESYFMQHRMIFERAIVVFRRDWMHAPERIQDMFCDLEDQIAGLRQAAKQKNVVEYDMFMALSHNTLKDLERFYQIRGYQ